MPSSPSTAKPLLVIIAAVMALTSLVFSSLTWSRVTESIATLGDARQARTAWERLLSMAKDAESGQRGYQITGEEPYLEPLQQARDQIPRLLELLTGMAMGNAVLDADVREVRSLTMDAMASLNDLVLIRRREGEAAARAVLTSDSAKRGMDRLRKKLGELITDQEKTVQASDQIMRKDLKWGYAAAMGAGGVALGAGVLAALLLRESLMRLRREQRLTEEKRRAEQADRQKNAFLATMSHEIRTPMNAILGFGELLEGELTGDREKRYLQAILTGGRSLLQIINDIIDLSKMEAAMLEVNAEPTSLDSLAQFIWQLFGEQAERAGLSLRVEVAPDVPRSLLLDEMRLRQILLSLVGNALKFTEKGFVAVRFTARQNPTVRSRVHLGVQVEDSGTGIPADRQAEIFQPFVQAGGTSARHGTGLGLAIVRRLTELMGGTVKVESELGRGTTFHLQFPVVEISARLAVGTGIEEAEVDFDELRPANLLVADDNPVNRDLVLGIFENTHHAVRVAGDGKEAVREALRARPDEVLMDIRMPGMDGREGLKALRARPELELLPVIAVTASSLADKDSGPLQAIDGYVRKPFSRAELFRQLALFILRVDVSPAESPGPDEEPMTARKSADWLKLTTALRALEQDRWPSVRDGMAMNQVKQFAAAVLVLGKDADCPPVRDWAVRLSDEAEGFLLNALETSLGSFPALIASVAARAASPAV